MLIRSASITLVILLLSANLHSQDYDNAVFPEYHKLESEGNQAKREKDWKKAIKLYTKAIELVSNEPSIYILRGQSKSKLTDYRGAIEDYTKAIEIAESAFSGQTKLFLGETISMEFFGQFYWHRGLAKYQLGDQDGACRDFSKSGQLGFEKAYDSIQELCN